MATITLTNNHNTFTMIYNYNESTNKFSITDSYIVINKANSDDCQWVNSVILFDALVKIKKWNKNGYINATTLLQCSYRYQNNTYIDDSGIVTWASLGFTNANDTSRKIQLHTIVKDDEITNNFSNSSGKSTWNYTFSNSASNLINIEISINIRGNDNQGNWTDVFFDVKDNKFLILPESSGSIVYSEENLIEYVHGVTSSQLYYISSLFKLMFCTYNINTTAKTATLYVCPMLCQTEEGIQENKFTSYYSTGGTTPKFYIKDINNSNSQKKFIFPDSTWIRGQAYIDDESQWDGYCMLKQMNVWYPMYCDDDNPQFIGQGNNHLNPNNFITTVKLNNNGQISVKYGFNFRMYIQATSSERAYFDISSIETETITSPDINIQTPYDGSFAKKGDFINALNSGITENGITYSNLKNYETLRQYVYAFTNDSNLSTAITIESEGTKITYTNLIKPLNKIRTLLNSGNYTIPTSVLSTTKQDTIKNTTFSQGSKIVALKDYFTVINYLSSHY